MIAEMTLSEMNKKKLLLMALAPAILIDALIELSIYDQAAEKMIDNLISTPSANIKRFKSKLSQIKRRHTFYDWRRVREFSGELIQLLEILKIGNIDAKTAIELLLDFYQADEHIINMADDSNGDIGVIFNGEAKEIFLHHATSYPDKNYLAEKIVELSMKDDYGVRQTLVDCASQYLPNNAMEYMVNLFWKKTESEMA